MQAIKCVIVGDSIAGKTCMLISYTTNKFPSEYVPNIFDNYAATVTIGDVPHTLGLFDTAGQEDYDRLRQLCYSNTDIFLVCYSVVSPSSYRSVSQKWIPEIVHHCRKVPYLLVGMETHLRDDPTVIARLKSTNEQPLTAEQGELLARKLKAVRYLECSAETQNGLKEVFHEAVVSALYYKNRLRRSHYKSCILL